MSDVTLLEESHPNPDAAERYASLIGIDEQRDLLLGELAEIVQPGRFKAWASRHHPAGITLTTARRRTMPLVILSGDVGCGKTALATSVGTPLAKTIDRKVLAVETPSDLRGWGHVGELSARVTTAFAKAGKRVKAEGGVGLLIVDEADDVATARAQMQAHHEDRAGLNVLIKEVDQLSKSGVPIAVLLITNRPDVLDPAVVRRAALNITFERPSLHQREVVLERLLGGVKASAQQIRELAVAAERGGVPFSYSDLTDRLARGVLRMAQHRDVPITVALVRECLAEVEPSPLMESKR